MYTNCRKCVTFLKKFELYNIQPNIIKKIQDSGVLQAHGNFIKTCTQSDLKTTLQKYKDSLACIQQVHRLKRCAKNMHTVHCTGKGVWAMRP